MLFRITESLVSNRVRGLFVKNNCNNALYRLYSSVDTVPKTSDLISIIKNNHPYNNIPDSIIEKVGRNLHLQNNHPLKIIKQRIETYCNTNGLVAANQPFPFQLFDNLSPIVDTYRCFDALRVPPEHVSRRPSDTYYVDTQTVLRTHTSAHQTQLIADGIPAFLCAGDVYRRDEVDATHYPVFHQMEGVRIYQPEEFPADMPISDINKRIESDLKALLSGLAVHLFGDVEMRWREDYFPFTEPSFELEVLFNGQWLEVLGCGVIHREVMQNAKQSNKHGWAFGLGLERLAMVLFSVPDIRLFWSNDDRFLSQFNEKSNKMVFQPYSKYPLCYKDVSFWLPQSEAGVKDFHVNDVYELIRGIAGDLVEKVEKFDEFSNKKTGKTSHAYRIIYRSMDRSLTNAEVDALQEKFRADLVEKLRVELR
eukprot:gene10403-13973_t